MKSVLEFLTELSVNNNKPWFDAHKGEYLAAKSRFESYAGQILAGIGEFDTSVRNLSLKDCMYRIYRDLRFTTDKRPYKSYMSLFVVKGGKKSGNAGYYMHIQPSGESFLWAGLHEPQPAIVRSVREEISLDGHLFDEALAKAEGFSIDRTDTLKRVPYEYPSDSPYAEWLKLKSFGMEFTMGTSFITSADFVECVVKRLATTQSFVELLNRSVDYAREMEAEGPMY